MVAVVKHKRYYGYGHRKYNPRFHPRRQLEQHDERWSVYVESEQWTDEYEFQYRFPCRQELQAPPEWQLITVTPRRQEDLPFALSWYGSDVALCLTVALNRIARGAYQQMADLRLWRTRMVWAWAVAWSVRSWIG